jgi:hypothetical protein
MAYRFTQAWAAGQIAVGFLSLFTGIGAAIWLFVWPPDLLSQVRLSPAEKLLLRLTISGLLILVGLALGAPLIVTGQLVQVQLATLRRLSRIAGYLRRWEHERFDREQQERRARRLPKG